MGGWAAGQLVGEEEVGWRGETKEKQGQAGGAGGSEGVEGLTGWADAGEAAASAEDSEVTFSFKQENAGVTPHFGGGVFTHWLCGAEQSHCSGRTRSPWVC